MDLKLLMHFIFLCVFNIIFFFSGVILNTLVIITILKTTQLRKKLCHFMIMVLSCCDLLTVVIYSLGFILYFIMWFTESNDLYETERTYRRFTNIPAGVTLSTLMVMCIERYLGVYHPFFHRTSVTRRKLLILLAIMIILPTTSIALISINYMVISRVVALSTFMVLFLPPFIFINYKLFKISRKRHRQNGVKRRTSLQNINTCLLVVACLVLFSIPVCFRVVFSSVEGLTSEDAKISGIWAATAYLMNSSCNSLIFFWKNKVLRVEGIKIIKKIKDCVLGS